MNLTEIEAKADNVADSLMIAGRGEAELLALHLQGLKALTSIKAIVAHQKRMDSQTYPPMYVPGAMTVGPCGHRAPTFRLVNCNLSAGHLGGHANGELSWTSPANPAVDRLHELVSYCRKHEREAPVGGGGGAYGDVGDQLDEILREGEL